MTNDKLHAAMAGFVARGEIPGIVTLVARGDDVFVDAVGTTTTGGPDNQPMQRDTIFRIASLTKPIAAAATMMLVDDGLLRLPSSARPAIRTVPSASAVVACATRPA
jgi:CubicO group peptidase (beta-lactamase class C family)